MLKLFYAATPPSLRVVFFLEEAKLNYNKLPINVFKKGAHLEEYVKVNPLKKTPAIIDNGKTYVDSANILLHLAQQHNKLLPEDISWFFWGTSELNPKFMHHVHEILSGNTNTEMMDKLKEQIDALLAVLNNQLTTNNYVAGENYSIADINIYATIKMYLQMDFIPNLLANSPNIVKWVEKINSKESVKKTLEIASSFNKELETTNEEIANFLNS